MTNTVSFDYIYTCARVWFSYLSIIDDMRRVFCQWTNFLILFRSIPSSSINFVLVLIDSGRRMLLRLSGRTTKQNIIDDRALSSAAESLIFPVGIKKPLSLLEKIEIEYESSKEMQKGEKRTRIRRISELQDLRREKERRGLRLIRGKDYEKWAKKMDIVAKEKEKTYICLCIIIIIIIYKSNTMMYKK